MQILGLVTGLGTELNVEYLQGPGLDPHQSIQDMVGILSLHTPVNQSLTNKSIHPSIQLVLFHWRTLLQGHCKDR